MTSSDGGHITKSVMFLSMPRPPNTGNIRRALFARPTARPRRRRIAHPALELGGAGIKGSFGGPRLGAPGETQRGDAAACLGEPAQVGRNLSLPR